MLDRKKELIDYFIRTLGYIPRNVGLLGLGKSNLALLFVLSEIDGISITLRDSRDDIKSPLAGDNCRILLGSKYLEEITEDILFLSPSLKRDGKELSAAKKRGIILSSDCEVFFSEKRAELIIAVSGSDGKSTVTELTSRLLLSSGISAEAIGNIGTPYIGRSRKDAYVTELSSFNLEYLKPKSNAAAITSIAPNHLNWHTSLEEYIEAKKNVIRLSEKAVLSCDDKYSRVIAKEAHPYAVFSTSICLSELRNKFRAEHYYTLEDGYVSRDGESLISVCDVTRREEYNVRNLMCALALSDGYVTSRAIEETAKSFTGLPHRCELVYFKNGISAYDSSIDTSPARTAATLSALDKKVHILLGGRGKGLSPSVLSPTLRKYAKRIGIYGESRDELASFLDNSDLLSEIPHSSFENFEDALLYLLDGLESGDTVLLSPACTAYGEFTDFEERGRVFAHLIKKHLI